MRTVSIPRVNAFPDNVIKLTYNPRSIIGSGKFANVYQHPKHKHQVWKITMKPDSAYAAWIEYALAYQGNRYVPRIYEAMINEFGHLAVRMEKLDRLDLNPWSNKRTPSKLVNQYYKLGYPYGTFNSVDRIQIERILHDLRCKHDFRLDLHDANVMLRGRQLVVTDPVWDGGVSSSFLMTCLKRIQNYEHTKDSRLFPNATR